MPRIRTLKPEHKSHRKVGRLTDRQYRLWVGMVTEADDEGRLVADADQLRVQIFAYRPEVTDEIVTEERDYLAKVRLIRLYKSHSTLYAVFPSWQDHQRIDKPKPSTYPRDAVRDRSKNGHGTVPDDSKTIPRGSEGSGSDRKDPGSGSEGREGAGGKDSAGARAQDQSETKKTILAVTARSLGITVEQLKSDMAKKREEQR